MSSFLNRYMQGEHEQVWAELTALGDQVREESYYDDALAVAHETMRRARNNIEVLIPRLAAVGYQFGYGWVQPFFHERLRRPLHVTYPRQRDQTVAPTVTERFTYYYRISYQEYLELALTMPPLFVPANDREEQIAALERTIAESAPSQAVFRQQLRAMQAELQARPSALDLLAELEALLGTVPLSVRAWYEEVGGVNFVGDHPGWRDLLPETASTPSIVETEYLNPMHVLDPLLIYPLDKVTLARWHGFALQHKQIKLARDNWPTIPSTLRQVNG